MSICMWSNEDCIDNGICDCCESCGPQDEDGKTIINYGDLNLCTDCREEREKDHLTTVGT